MIGLLRFPPLAHCRPRHATARRENFLCISHRHAARFPAARLHDRGKIDIQGQKILRSADPDRATADLIHLLGRHPDPARHSLIDVRNDVRMKAIADAVLTN